MRLRVVRRARTGLVCLGFLAGCSGTQTPVPAASSGASPAAIAPAPTARTQASKSAPGKSTKLAEPGVSRNWIELRRQAALRMVEASPNGTYVGVVPDILLAIPVLEIELNADGSIRKIEVLRRPRAALETVQLAIDAVHRAAPYGDVSKLPKPWRFTETFLFDDAYKFKPRTLD
jgi:hypothetical protein